MNIEGKSEPLSNYPKASNLYAHKRKLMLPDNRRIDFFIANWSEAE
jgi:hypothetical protein